jgi:hypothetical protein
MSADRQLGMLEPAQRDRLAVLEAVVERGLETFVEVGAALSEIRDGGLYRDTHGTFDSYCRERWGFSRRTGYDLMQTAEVATTVQDLAHLPSREAARELAPLRAEPEQVREAWAETVERHGEHPTAKQTRAVVNGRRPAPPQKPPPPPARPPQPWGQQPAAGETVWEAYLRRAVELLAAGDPDDVPPIDRGRQAANARRLLDALDVQVLRLAGGDQ